MAARAAKVESRKMGAKVASSGEGAVVSHLAVRERADKEVAFPHVGEAALDIERRAGERRDNRVPHVRGVLLPEAEHLAPMLLSLRVPVEGVAAKAIG